MKKLTIAFSLIGLVILAVSCGSKSAANEKVIKSAPAGNNLNVSLATQDGILKHGNAEFTLSFTDAAGKPVEVGAVALTFHMPQMGTMAEMNNAATFTSTGSPGVYQGKVKLGSAGDWQAQISYEGAAGKGKSSFTVTAQ